MDVVGGAEDAVGAGLVGGPGQQHEVGRAARHEERIVRLERDEDRAAAALLHEVEAVVEELAEEHEPEVERRGQARVRRRVGDEEQIRHIVGCAEDPVQPGAGDGLGEGIGRRGGDRRRVITGLVDDQVADDAWLRVDDEGVAGLCIGRPGLGRAEDRVGQAREQLVRGAEILLPRDQVVERPVDRPEAERHLRVRKQGEEIRSGRMLFRNDDLLEYEL